MCTHTYIDIHIIHTCVHILYAYMVYMYMYDVYVYYIYMYHTCMYMYMWYTTCGTTRYYITNMNQFLAVDNLLQ